MQRTVWGLIALICISSSVLPRNACAQAVSGSITGAVLDSSGAGVPTAKVSATNLATGVQISSETNQIGYYNLSNLTSGTYQLDVAAKGFRPYRQTSVEVTIGGVVRLDMQLEVGGVQEQVTIHDVAPLVKDDKVNLGGTVTSYQMESLPTLGRNPTALAKLQPGITEGPNQEGLPNAGGTVSSASRRTASVRS